MPQFKTFTGGPYETNCFLLEAPGGGVLFDAPEGADARFAGEKIGLLVLTHGHWDHTQDAACIKRATGAIVRAHRADQALIETPEVMAAYLDGSRKSNQKLNSRAI